MWVLTIDIGNSNIKVGVFDKRKLVIAKSFSSSIKGLESLINFLETKHICFHYAAVASVKPSIETVLVEYLGKLGIKRILSLSSRTARNVKVDYLRPEKLGPDRLASAYFVKGFVKKDSVIVDAGTAITVDFIGKDGHFFGGVILPGYEVLMNSLKKAELLRKIKLKKSFEIPGKDTDECVTAGIFFMLNGGINLAVEEGIKRLGFKGPEKFLTGGGAGNLKLNGFKNIPFLTLLGLLAFVEELQK